MKPHNTGDTEYVVARLNPDGSLDRTFGNNKQGMWVSNPTSGDEAVRELAVLTDAANHVTGIMVGGTAPAAGFQSFAAVKLTPAGLPAASFGAGGYAVANVGGATDGVGGMAVTPGGGVVLVGTVSQPGHVYGAVMAFTAAGQLDPTFNRTGYRVDDLTGAGGPTAYMAVAVQPAAGGGYRIVVAGHFGPPNGIYSGVVARYTSAGQLDPTFGSGGFLATTAAGDLHDVALAADGSIVVAGSAYYTGTDGQPNHIQMAVGHLTADGALDTTFGTAGTGISTVPAIDVTEADDANALAIGPDGWIVLAGWTGGGTTRQASFARFTAP